MTLLQVLLILLGFAGVTATVFAGSVFFKKLFIGFLKTILTVKIVFFTPLIAALPFRNHPWSSVLLKLKVRYVPDLIYAGCFIAYLAGLLLFPSALKRFKVLLFDQTPAFYNLIRVSAASTFLFSATAAIFFFDQSLVFFASCGYSKGFMIFIISLELLCGLLLLLRKTAGYAALLLACDMAGAIATHYHNYFQKNFPNPLGNSVPALVTLTLLITVICLNTSLEKQSERKIL